MALRPVLIDTGPLVAYLDRTDAEHEAVSGFLDDFKGMLCTTTAVITEAMYLLKDAPTGPRRLAEFADAARLEIAALTDTKDLLLAADLIEKYASVPMDFADATLVMLSDELNSTRIITLDRRGFRIYRRRKGRRTFEILPA